MTETVAERKSLGKLTVAELEEEIRRVADESGQDLPETAGLKKADLVAVAEALLAAGQARGGEPDPGVKGPPEEAEIIESRSSGARLPAVRAHEAMVARGEVTVAEIVAQRDKIKQVMEQVMTEGVHYGLIPGINKPSLFKPGAEVLNVTFRLAPSYDSERLFSDDGHLTVIASCSLTHATTGIVLGSGEGMCSSRESKYAWRMGGRVCPACGADTIKKSKFPPRENDYPGAQRSDPPGWYCHAKSGGCGANFAADDTAIAAQETGRRANPDLADSWNTVLKMADKRALVAAVLNVTAASDIFTQDVEDSRAAETVERRDQVEAEDYRKEYPDYNWPRSWGELNERMTALVGKDEAVVWMRQALEVTYPGTSSLADVTQAQRVQMFRKCSGALAAIDSTPSDPMFDPEQRERVQAAFASQLGGAVLDGPPWRLSPKEEDRPTRDDWLAEQKESGTSREEDLAVDADEEAGRYAGGYE